MLICTPPSNPSILTDCETPSKLMLPKSQTSKDNIDQSNESPTCSTTSKFSEECDVEATVDLWEQFSLFKQEDDLNASIYDNESEYSSTDDEDDFESVKPQRPTMVTLPCGDIHICGGGFHCPFVIPNEDRILVCPYSGIGFGPEQTDEFFDLNGGTGKRSGDPDQTCGEPMHGKFLRRPDPLAASKAAYQAAHNMSDTEIAVYIPSDAAKERASRRPAKRGALCVGEVSERNNKKGRVSKKAVNNHDVCANLYAEAESVIEKLVNFERASSFKKKRTGDKIVRNRPPPDPRMCNEAFVFNVSVKKYVRSCLSNSTAPSIDAINNLAMMAQDVSKRAREDAESDTRDSLRTAKFRNLCSRMIVALWGAACKTPYMENAKRGTDAYRPFICGVIYATKRGVALADGTILVPKCPQLAAALPVLRGTGGNAIAKTLHSSSHRGLCTLSRCISSVPQTEQNALFDNAIRMARSFSSATFSKYDI